MDRRDFLSRMIMLSGGIAVVAATAGAAQAFTVPALDAPTASPDVYDSADEPTAENVRWVWRRRRRRIIRRRRFWRRRRM